MKTGYSLLLGEFVPADQVRYGDTAGFQIVCPCCKDPVLKTERLGAVDVVEFLSHYPGKQGVDSCELRVASLSASTQDDANRISRGQTLKAFLSTLRDAVGLRWAEHDMFATEWSDVEEGLGLERLQRYWEGKFMSGDWLSDHEVDRYLDLVVTNVDFSELREQGGLALSFRRRLVEDIVSHLRAPHAARNRRYMVQAAIKDTFYILVGSDGRPRTEAVARLLWNLCFVPDAAAWNRLAALIADARTEECGLFHKLHEATQLSVVRLLVSLPTLPMLENHRAGRPLLHGVERLDFLPYDVPHAPEAGPPGR